MANTAQSCLAGDTSRCNEIKDSQDPVTGVWYRNPYERRHPEAATGQPLFSRDALEGLMAYIVVSHDKPALNKWLNFVLNQFS